MQADADRIRELLADETLSFRAIAREVGCSDWTVRRIAREIDGDLRPMKRGDSEAPDEACEGSETAVWIGLAATLALAGLAIWFGLRGMPPPET
jgi:hypothetical protein